MSSTRVSVTLSEWETIGPANCPELDGRFLDHSGATKRIVKELDSAEMIRLRELRSGLEVGAFSYVGRITLGDVCVTILPKIPGRALLSLLRYAYGFRRLALISESEHEIDGCGFEDLLVFQLNAEVQELISRGLLRAYVPMSERLSSPRGRIDLMRMALDGGRVMAMLPCRHHPRIEDTLLNRTLVAGLELAGSIASVVELRRESRRLASLLAERVAPINLSAATLDRAALQMNRMTRAYSAALSIIRLLFDAQGVVLEGESTATTLPGFLFDMNAFFQALMSRFLRENLAGHTVKDERGLKGMMRYNPKFNPQHHRSPTPRPDFVVIEGGNVRAILDAKYRDIWRLSLPRDMLYQLVVYAIGHGQCPQSSILYPTTDATARESRIDVSDAIVGSHLAQVCLRPVVMPRLEEMLLSTSAQARRERENYARVLAFGESAAGAPVSLIDGTGLRDRIGND